MEENQCDFKLDGWAGGQVDLLDSLCISFLIIFSFSCQGGGG